MVGFLVIQYILFRSDHKINKMIKNNVTRLLSSRKIPFTTFELPEVKMGAQETAEYLEIPLQIVYKTIVIKTTNKKKNILAIIPGNQVADLKAIASFCNEKKVFLATQNEAETITHLKTGGISPLALLNKGFLIILDKSATKYETIHISGGQIGLNIRLPVKSLINITKAKIGNVAKKD